MKLKIFFAATSFLLVAGVAIAQTVDTQPPTAPTNLTGSVTTKSVSLSWTASTDDIAVVAYKIFRDGSMIGQNSGSTSTPATTFYDSGLSSSTTYSYSVIAYDAAGNASTAATKSVTTATPPPPPPPDTTSPSTPGALGVIEDYDYTISVSGPNTHNMVVLQWSASTDNVGVAGYNVYRSGVKIATVPLPISRNFRYTSPYYIDPTTSGYTQYTYSVNAYDAAGNLSTNSVPTTFTTSIRSGATVQTTASKVQVYDSYVQKTIGSEGKGAIGTVFTVTGTSKCSRAGRCTFYLYYGINFKDGVSGWVNSTEVQGVLTIAEDRGFFRIFGLGGLFNNMSVGLGQIFGSVGGFFASLAGTAAASR